AEAPEVDACPPRCLPELSELAGLVLHDHRQILHEALRWIGWAATLLEAPLMSNGPRRVASGQACRTDSPTRRARTSSSTRTTRSTGGPGDRRRWARPRSRTSRSCSRSDTRPAMGAM